MYYVEKAKKEMICKYDLKTTGYVNVISELKVEIHNGSLKMKNYEIKQEQLQQNRMVSTNAFQPQKKLNGTGKEDNIAPDLGETTKFWSDICSVLSNHHHDAWWLKRVRQVLADA